METMLRKMAWAMCYKWALDDYEEEEARKTADIDWPDWVEVAKAALAAIREPMLNIQGAGWEAAVDNEGCTPECCWVAMIDAILSEEG